jgi:hypothetical protein
MWLALASEQEEHQRSFAREYPGCSRPKHHCRLHLPHQYKKHKLACNCWGVESSHKNYKSLYADSMQQFLQRRNGGSEMSRHLLPRMLLRATELLQERPLLPCGFELQHPFSENEVEDATNMVNTQISGKCRLEMIDLQEGDYLLYGDSWNKACQIHFFLPRNNRLYFFVTSLHPITAKDSFKTFHNKKQKDVIEYTCMTNMHVPAWITAKGNVVMFLP